MPRRAYALFLSGDLSSGKYETHELVYDLKTDKVSWRTLSYKVQRLSNDVKDHFGRCSRTYSPFSHRCGRDAGLRGALPCDKYNTILTKRNLRQSC